MTVHPKGTIIVGAISLRRRTLHRAPRGTQDILPEDQRYWWQLRDRIRHICQLFGYYQIDTPTFEDTSLFVRGVGEGTDIVDKEMYTFEDKGGQSLTLRPEFTVTVVRAYLEHGMRTLPQPVKLYSVGPIFRYERPQAGRYRQHTQFNVEAIGEIDPAVDFEVMSIAWQLYVDLGFANLAYQINSTGCPQCRPTYLEVLLKHYREHEDRVCDDCRRRLARNPLRVLDCKETRCQPIIDGAPHIRDYLCEECATHLDELLGYFDLIGRPYLLNHRLVRGLDYYTKTVFEVWAEGIGAQSAICGGGRYDGLAEALGGPSTPGVGFGSGMERIILSMKSQGLEVPALPTPVIAIVPLGHRAKQRAVALLTDLRSSDIGAILIFGDRSLKAQLRQANRANVIYAIIVGDSELDRSQVLLRNMQLGTQEEIPEAAVLPEIQARLKGATAA